jgi:hypothetical protein
MPVELRKQPTLVESFLLRLADLRIRFRVRLFGLASWLPRWSESWRQTAGKAEVSWSAILPPSPESPPQPANQA